MWHNENWKVKSGSKTSPQKSIMCSALNYLPGGLVSCTSLVTLTLGVAGWWNSDLLFITILALELWIFTPSKATIE